MWAYVLLLHCALQAVARDRCMFVSLVVFVSLLARCWCCLHGILYNLVTCMYEVGQKWTIFRLPSDGGLMFYQLCFFDTQPLISEMA